MGLGIGALVGLGAMNLIGAGSALALPTTALGIGAAAGAAGLGALAGDAIERATTGDSVLFGSEESNSNPYAALTGNSSSSSSAISTSSSKTDKNAIGGDVVSAENVGGVGASDNSAVNTSVAKNAFVSSGANTFGFIENEQSRKSMLGA